MITTTSVPDVRTELRDLICGGITPLTLGELSDDTDLIDSGILDSLGVAEVLSFIADRIGRELSADEHVRATVQSVNSIVVFIERRRVS